MFKITYEKQILVLAFLANFSQFGSRVAISPLVPDIMSEYSLTKSEVGVLLTGLWVAFALLQYPSGVLAERFGKRRVILVALGLTAVFSFLLFIAPNLSIFTISILFLGAGAGLYLPVGTVLLTDILDINARGRALGIHNAGGPIAGLAIPPLVVTVATLYGWKVGFLVTATAVTITVILFYVLLPPISPSRPDSRLRNLIGLQRTTNFLSKPDVLITLGVATIGMYAFQSFLSFFPVFLIEHANYNAAKASFSFAFAFALSGLSLPLQGWLSDKLAIDMVLAGGLTVAAVGFSILIFGPLSLTLVGIAVLASGLGWAGVLQARFMRVFSREERSSGFGLMRTIYLMLGASGNFITGFLADNVGWVTAYGVVAGFLFVGVVILIFSWLSRIPES